MKTPIRLSLLILFALLLAACGGSGSESSPDSADTADSASDSSADSSDSGDSGGSVDTASGPSSLDLTDMSAFPEVSGDYGTQVYFNFQGLDDSGNPIESTLDIDGAFQEDPAGSRVDMQVTGAGDLGGTDTVTYVDTGGTLYFYTPVSGCAILPSQGDTPYEDFVDTGGLLTGVVQRVQPDETVNGVPSYVYAITNDNLDLSDPAGSDIREISSGQLYVAQDGGYVTRIYLEGRGVSEVLTQSNEIEGDIVYQLDFTPIPEGITLDIPAGCAAPSTEDAPYPVLDDATGITSLGGFYQYTTNVEFDAVVNFYKDELDALGWALTDETLYGDTGLLGFAMDGRQLNIVISGDPNSSAIIVNIGEQ